MADPQLSAPPRAPYPVAGSVPRTGVVHVRHRHTDRFTVVGNHLAQHRELSLAAIGLAVHIQSLPDGARVDIKTLAARFPEGETRIAAALRELEGCGYLSRKRERLPSGRVITRTTAYAHPGARSGGDTGGRPRVRPAAGGARTGPTGRRPGTGATGRPGTGPAGVYPPDVSASHPGPTGTAATPPAARVPAPRPKPVPVPARAFAPRPKPKPKPSPNPGPAAEPAAGSAFGPGPRPTPGGEAPAAPTPTTGRGAVPIPVPAPAPASPPLPEPRTHDLTRHRTATGLLARLRRDDARLLLSERDVRRLAPAVAAWLERGADPDAVRHTLTGGLPDEPLRHPAGLLAHRLTALLPPPAPAALTPVPGHPRPAPLQNCDGCDRAYRAPEPGGRCRDCRAAERTAA